MIQLYFGVGACSFVPHVGLELIKAHSHVEFEPRLVRLHKGEHRTPEFLAMNPNAQVPVLLVNGKPLTQIVAICDFLDRRYPEVGLLPAEPWERAQALSQLAWMNSTAHPTFTRIYFKERFAETEAAQAEVKRRATEEFRGYLGRVQDWVRQASPFWFGERPSFHDAYAFTLLRWGGVAGIDPAGLPEYKAYVERLVRHPAVAAAMARERIALDTYKA